MPTYEYYCGACDERFEVDQRITDAPLKECPRCSSPVRKLISRVGVIFKGPGFHINDYRKPETKKESSEKSVSAPKTETKTETPAPAATAAK